MRKGGIVAGWWLRAGALLLPMCDHLCLKHAMACRHAALLPLRTLTRRAWPANPRRCRTQHVPRDLNPVFDEFFEVGNVPTAGCRLDIEVGGGVCCC